MTDERTWETLTQEEKDEEVQKLLKEATEMFQIVEAEKRPCACNMAEMCVSKVVTALLLGTATVPQMVIAAAYIINETRGQQIASQMVEVAMESTSRTNKKIGHA